MNQTEVLTHVFIPFTEPLSFTRAFKQARRRDDDISIVTSCFSISLQRTGADAASASESEQQYTITDAALSFGGVGPTTRMAPLTQAYLRGLPFNAATFDGAYEQLARDIDIPANAPGGQVEYRRSLCASFLFKFYLQVAQALGLPLAADAVSAVTSPSLDGHALTHGSQEYQETPQTLQPVGQTVVHASAALQVSGEAKYVDDIPAPPRTLHAAPVMSARPHARIVSIDASKALAVPGVVAFISASDIPAGGHNTMGEVVPDEECFASREVHCVGQLIGLLVAESDVAATHGAKLVHVQYEDLLAVLSIDDALQSQSFFPVVHTLKQGAEDMDAALAQYAHVVEGTVRMGGQEHFYFETNACLVVPGESGGELTIYASTQNANSTQEWAAHVLGVPANRIVCKVKRLGGGFGGKETRSINLSTAVAVAAWKLDVPVKCTLERNADMAFSGQRHPFYG